MRAVAAVLAGVLVAAGCTPAAQVQIGPDGRPLPRVYRIDAEQTRRIPFRMLDSVNALRSAAGAPPLAFSSQLNAAAATHARDMSVQNRPWHFGSDGSSPLDRVRRVGYAGSLRGELISETFETELETLSAWMARPDTRGLILDPTAREVGFAWFQETNGKIWWAMVLGS